MWIYQKTLQHPVNLKNKDLKMAKFLITQFGGPNGELGAALRYLSQRYTMPTGKSKALLTDIGTEELAHVEMIATMVYQLTSDATPEELKAAGLGSNYAQNGYGIFPSDASGVPFSASTIAVMGNPITDLHEDMAAEQKALSTYYQLINLTDDVDLKETLGFLGQREIIHYQRFGEALMDVYDYEESQKTF
ncbi:manganese catalase family protein [Metaclostridioides mangenotii]|uniref:manganese catalase family protein n=1 Tax=Metaclostridioides mangenotii TaxID=1540 RepID=UPI0004851033|nr:manganese catalase family protein [Clostridioides mangenotii]